MPIPAPLSTDAPSVARLLTGLQAIHDRITQDGRLSPAGMNLEFTRAVVPQLHLVTVDFADALDDIATADAKRAKAKEAALAELPPVSDVLFAEIARVSREDEAFRGQIESLAMVGPSADADAQTLFRAFVRTPSPALFGLSSLELTAARDRVTDLVADTPEDAQLVRDRADAVARGRRIRSVLDALQPELDYAVLVEKKVLYGGPTTMSAEENAAWQAEDMQGWIFAAADPSTWYWVDPRKYSRTSQKSLLGN